RHLRAVALRQSIPAIQSDVYLRERHLTPYRWIAPNLRMGATSYVQCLVSRRRQQKDSKNGKYYKNMEN
ncbi:MAG: hypothetical protein ACLFS4_09025, partial [Opitutales bacterium]